jgi:hypothetical protein
MPKEKIFVFSYQTQLLISDLKALEAEAAEVWEEYRQRFETVPGITMAVLQANEMPSGVLIQKGKMYSFVIQRHSNGSWEWLKAEGPK